MGLRVERWPRGGTAWEWPNRGGGGPTARPEGRSALSAPPQKGSFESFSSPAAWTPAASVAFGIQCRLLTLAPSAPEGTERVLAGPPSWAPQGALPARV